MQQLTPNAAHILHQLFSLWWRTIDCKKRRTGRIYGGCDAVVEATPPVLDAWLCSVSHSGYLNWYGGGLSRHPPLKCVTQRAAVSWAGSLLRFSCKSIHKGAFKPPFLHPWTHRHARVQLAPSKMYVVCWLFLANNRLVNSYSCLLLMC